MKHLTLILATLTLMACGTQTPKEKQNNTPWPIEPKNDKVEYMLMLDSINYARMGDKRDIDDVELRAFAEMSNKPTTPKKIKEELSKTYDDAEELWHKFVWLCNEEREEEAIAFYRDNHLMIDLALSHSEVRLALHDEIIGVMAYDNLSATEAANLMIDLLEFDMAMIEVNYTSTHDVELLNMYEYVFELLNTQYYSTERYDDLLSLIDRWAKTTWRADGSAAREAMVKVRRAEVYYTKGEIDTSLNLLYEAKTQLESAIAAGDYDYSPESGLEVVTNIIEMFSNQQDKD